MSETRTLIVETAERMFRDLAEPTVVDAAEKGEWPEALWQAVEEAGLTVAGVPEDLGGAGAEFGDGLAALRIAGRHALPIPFGETVLAGLLLARAGCAVPSGPLTIAPHSGGAPLELARDADGWRLSGTAAQVPWAAKAARVVAMAACEGETYLVCADPSQATVETGANIAGEPRDRVIFDGMALSAGDAVTADRDSFLTLGALVRSLQMAGAMEAILGLSATYAVDRVQFGRPIAKFQAVQQSLAVVAGEVSAAGMAAEIALNAAQDGGVYEVAIAKARVGEAAGKVAELSHQVHGAIGFTHEYQLHHFTRRLWAWRDEFGGEPYWQTRLGRLLAKEGADKLWPIVSGTQEVSL